MPRVPREPQGSDRNPGDQTAQLELHQAVVCFVETRFWSQGLAASLPPPSQV